VTRSRKARQFTTIAILAGALLASIISMLAGEGQRRFVFDNWQRLGTHSVSTKDVVVVLIDDESVERVGQWPWLRTNVAVLINQISLGNPAALGADIYFTQPDPIRPEAFASIYDDSFLDEVTREKLLGLPYGDQDLEMVLQTVPTVLARASIDCGNLDTDTRYAGSEIGELTFETIEGNPPPNTAKFECLLASIPDFDVTADARGFVNGIPDSDGIVRRVPLSLVSEGVVASSFAVELAKMQSGVETLRWEGNTLLLGDRKVPSDAGANFEFKMAKYPEDQVIPAAKVLGPEFDPAQLAGKVVIVGVAATGTYDIVATPIAAEVPGALVQAQAVDAMLNNKGLSRASWLVAAEIVLAALFVGLIFAAGYWGNNRWLFSAIGIALVLPLASYLAFDQANLLFDPFRPMLVGLFAGIALLLARFALTLAELVDRRILDAEQQKENDNARDLQLRMVPSPERLSKLGKRTEISASLRPAKSVGGDFYDAFELQDERLLFLVGDVSGKGLGAALFMAFSKTAAKSKLLSSGNKIDDAVLALNDELAAEEDDRMDLTLLVGSIDCNTGAVEFVNAGHENPLLVRTTGEVEEIKLRGGPRLRSIDGFPYSTEHFQMSEGDTLVLISDGATDAADKSGAMFGLNGVLDAIRTQQDLSAAERVTQLASAVEQFEKDADPADDLTVMAVRYNG
jgi:adenylate cyclase